MSDLRSDMNKHRPGLNNATFYAFKDSPSMKWGYSGRGHLSREVFGVHDMDTRREMILADNDGCFPGMSTRADDYYLVVIGDEGNDHGWPLMFPPKEKQR
jgi:hypothetical protein